MRWPTGKSTRDERGVAAVEFALVVIPLLLIIGAIINLGVAFANQLSLDNAVRQAARVAVVDLDDPPDLTTLVIDQYHPLSSSTDPIVGTPDLDTCEGSDFGESITVTGEVTTTFIFPWPVLDDEITLNSEAVFQCEFS